MRLSEQTLYQGREDNWDGALENTSTLGVIKRRQFCQEGKKIHPDIREKTEKQMPWN